jgi:gliding motility-associated-like protein
MATQLSAGTYQVTVSANNTCTATASVVLTQPPPLQYSTNIIQPSCGSNDGSIALSVSGGSPPYSFTWHPSVSTTHTAEMLTAGNYKADITDQHLCSTEANIVLKEKPLQVYLGEDTSICTGDAIVLKPFESYASYQWQDNSTLSTYTVTQPGIYFLKVKNEAGCIATDTIQIVWDCGDIYFPSAFTPNYDGKNDTFGPLGNLSKVKNYRLTIYNRWGEQVFQSVNPYEKWNGVWKGQAALPGTYVYVAQFIFNETVKNKKGTLTLIP